MRETTPHRALVFTALLLAMFMSAIEVTIVATAMPSISAGLGGFELYSWVFSSYLLVQAVTIPIFGKLSDLVGRKPVFIGGVVVFLLGSVACGFAGTMATLIAFRFLQGLGAGAVQPVITTLAADLYPLEERGRVQGYISGLWGASSILGPLAGGLIVHSIGWPWIFWINLPFGIAAIVLIVIYLHEGVEPEARRIDYAGAVLLLAGLIHYDQAAHSPERGARMPLWRWLLPDWNGERAPSARDRCRVSGLEARRRCCARSSSPRPCCR